MDLLKVENVKNMSYSKITLAFSFMVSKYTSYLKSTIYLYVM